MPILRATLNVFVFAKCSKGYVYSKGQLISKADWRAMDELVLFASLLFTANKSNSSVCFLGESMARQSAFEIN